MKQLINEIFFTPLGQMSGFKFILLLVISVVCLLVVGYISVIAFKFLKTVFSGVKNILSAKHKCQKVQCKACGRTLDRCVCQRNRNRGYASRLYNYNKDERAKKHK